MATSISQMLELPSFPLLLTSILFFLMLVRYLNKFKGQGEVPPGPKTLPIIGNLHQLSGGLPHHALTRLCKEHGPVMKLQLGQVVSVVISSPEAAKEMLKTNDINFAQRPEVYMAEITAYDHSSLFFTPYNHYCKQVRKIAVMELLGAKRVLSFRSIREEEVWNLVEFISSSEGQAINLSDKIFTLISDLIARAAFGRKCQDQQNFITALEEIMNIGGGFDIIDLYPSLTFLRSLTGKKATLLRAHKKMDKILEDILAEHKAKKTEARNDNNVKTDDQEDIVDTLLSYADDSKNDFRLKIHQIKSIILDIFSAGSETSATTLEWAMSELLKNPRVMKRTQEEVRQACNGKNKIEEADIQKLDYLKLVIKETLRLHPAAPFYSREAIERCEIIGYTIQARAKILINVYAMGRDPTIWTDPECFIPERFEGSSIDFKGNNFELLPFGSGRRMCPGISFAIASIELALAQLLYHFDWKLPNGIKPEDLDMTEKFAITIRRMNHLHSIATVRIPFQKLDTLGM